MARKIYYRIEEDGRNQLSEREWDEIQRLQHWYNSEFVWTAGRLAFKKYAIFHNPDQIAGSDEDVQTLITKRRLSLSAGGLSEHEIIRILEDEGLIFVKRGGYFDNCLASGFTRVASNEYNAFLVCDFLLKCSRLAPTGTIALHDEGEFIKPKTIRMRNGSVIVGVHDPTRRSYFSMMASNRHVFAIVDSAKYDHLPKYDTTISGFNELPPDERRGIVRDWNWLGFESNYDINGDDIQGSDLNQKVAEFILEEPGRNS